ncbi:MAG: AMP-binding protein [Firmicutes bacterium]|nr:AMP-binding protein [Bacillota bacterium]
MKMKSSPFDPTCKDIRELVYGAASRNPANHAFKMKVKGEIIPITFPQMIRNIEALGTELMARGYNDCAMGIIGENSYPWYNCFLSIVCGGNVAVPFDKGFTLEELESSVNRSKIRLLFYDDKHEELIKQMRSGGRVHVDGYIKIMGEGNEYDEMLTIGEQRLSGGDSSYKRREINENALAVLLFTSGTTSQSKAVMLSHANIVSNVIDMYEYEAFFNDDVNMAFLPFHHSFGLVGALVFLGIGACSVFCDGLKYVTKNMKEYGVTVFVGVPLLVENMYHKIMKEVEKKGLTGKIRFGLGLCNGLDKIGIHARRKVFKQIIDQLGGKLRLIICGAAALTPEVAKGMNDFGILTIQGYGLTETSPVLSAESHEFMKAGSVGKPMPRVKLIISGADEEGIGEIVAYGPNVMLGYLDQPEETKAVLKDGWFYTGDLGKIDEDGFLWIRGRSKNVIVMKNGKNIFPEEIETMIDLLPYASQSLVFTREKHNELVLWAKIVYDKEYLKEHHMTEEQLKVQADKDIEAINDRMPRYKSIHHLILSSEPMIMTTTQKVKRNLEIERILKELEE